MIELSRGSALHAGHLRAMAVGVHRGPGLDATDLTVFAESSNMGARSTSLHGLLMRPTIYSTTVYYPTADYGGRHPIHTAWPLAAKWTPLDPRPQSQRKCAGPSRRKHETTKQQEAGMGLASAHRDATRETYRREYGATVNETMATATEIGYGRGNPGRKDHTEAMGPAGMTSTTPGT